MSLIKNINEIVPNIESVWNRKYNTIFQRQHWLTPYLSTSEVRLLVLQWKILHDIYPTGLQLKKMKIKDSDDCFLCNKKDTLFHFFFECSAVSSLWREVEKNNIE